MRNISVNTEIGQMAQKEMQLKHFLSRALVAPLFSTAEPFVQFLDQGFMRNISVKLFCIWTSHSGEICQLKIFLN